jgi:hypothetical protein
MWRAPVHYAQVPAMHGASARPLFTICPSSTLLMRPMPAAGSPIIRQTAAPFGSHSTGE